MVILQWLQEGYSNDKVKHGYIAQVPSTYIFVDLVKGHIFAMWGYMMDNGHLILMLMVRWH